MSWKVKKRNKKAHAYQIAVVVQQARYHMHLNVNNAHTQDDTVIRRLSSHRRKCKNRYW
jgi:hypothetical protein